MEHDENLERYQRLLRWLVRSNRSLTLDELAECLGIDLEEDNELMDFDSVETYPRNLLKRCSSLLTVSDDGRVSLAHYTVKEFLTSDLTRKNSTTFCVGKEEVEAELAQTCLTYLCYSDFLAAGEYATLELLDEYKFLGYAATDWGVPAEKAGGMGANLTDIATYFLKSSFEGRRNYEFWLWLHRFLKPPRRWRIPRSKPFFFAALYGLSQTLKNLLEVEDKTSPPFWFEAERDLIKEAAARGHADVVVILLEYYKVCGEAELTQYLYTACSYGQASSTKVLLDKGASASIVGGRQGTALQKAILEGHRDIVQILLARDANLEVVDAKFGIPLSAGAEMGHERIFQMLLNAGASVHGKGGWHAYPLISAIIGQNNTILQILLNKGVSINLIGG